MQQEWKDLGSDVTTRSGERRSGLSRRGFLQTASVVLGQAAFVPVLASCTGESPASRQPGGEPSGDGSVSSKLAELDKMSGAERQSYLEERAAKEGTVVMYSSSEPGLIRAWQDGFTAKYPDVNAQFQRMTGAQAMQKVTTESQTGRATASLFHTNIVSLAVALASDLAAPYASPETAGFDEAYVDKKDHYWGVEWADKYIIGFNTSKVSKAEVPRSIEGLAQPEWKGKLGVPSPGAPALIAILLQQMGDEQGKALLEKLASQEVRVYESNTEAANALGSGEISVVFSFLLSNITIVKQQGAPVDHLVSLPTVMNAGYQLILKDAPHPYAAALAYDYIMSKEGQEPVPDRYYLSPRDDVEQAPVQLETQQEAESLNSVANVHPSMFPPGNTYSEMFKDIFVRR